jgi:tetratricopeptide (TPR) repeat protein
MAPEHAKRAEAIRLLEQLVEAEAAPEDQFLLATLYSKTQGNWPQARSRMIALLASHGDRPGYVASYVEALLDRKEISEAELWLKRLEELSPGSLDTRGLRARAKVERKEFDEAVAYLIEPLAKPGLESSQRDRLLPAIASLLEQLSLRARENDQQEGAEKLAAEAETLYREHLEKAPEDFLRLASFLGRQNRPQEALELIEKAAAQDGGSTRVLLIRADFQIALEQFGEVETLYRKVLDDDPDDVIAMNNLAVLLALEGKQLDEALRLIDRAIELAGAGPTMLDSRATVHLARKELPKALADMEGALEDPHTPTRLFHLAQIKDRMNDRPGARRALGEAEKLDLDAGQLHPLERPVYDALKKKLSADGS